MPYGGAQAPLSLGTPSAPLPFILPSLWSKRNSFWGHLTLGEVGPGPENCKGKPAPKGGCPPTPLPRARWGEGLLSP